MELDLADDDLLPIIQIKTNQVCNDCGKINPHWCSISNAVFLFPSCARTHKKFNKNISTIKSLEVDDWSKEEILLLKNGGNERFSNLIKSYNIPLTIDNKEYKYYTKAAQYYREILLEESKNNDIKSIKKPSLREGIEILYQDEYLSLFNKNQANDSNISNEKNDNNQINNTENKNWMDKMIDKLEPDIQTPQENTSKSKQFFNNITNAINDVKERSKEIDIKGKFIKAGEFVTDKTIKIQNSGAFNKFMSVVSTGIDSVIHTTDKIFFKNDNSKIINVPPNYINPNLIPPNAKNLNPDLIKQNNLNININNTNNQINQAQNIINENQNNINNINQINEKKINPQSIKNEDDKDIKNDSDKQNLNNINNKDEKIDNEEKAKKDGENESEEKLDENDENDPSLLIMSNIPNHN